MTGVGLHEVEYRTGGSTDEWESIGTPTAVTLTHSHSGGPACGTTYEFRVRFHGNAETYAVSWGTEFGPASVATQPAAQRVEGAPHRFLQGRRRY